MKGAQLQPDSSCPLERLSGFPSVAIRQVRLGQMEVVSGHLGGLRHQFLQQPDGLFCFPRRQVHEGSGVEQGGLWSGLSNCLVDQLLRLRDFFLLAGQHPGEVVPGEGVARVRGDQGPVGGFCLGVLALQDLQVGEGVAKGNRLRGLFQSGLKLAGDTFLYLLVVLGSRENFRGRRWQPPRADTSPRRARTRRYASLKRPRRPRNPA